MFRRAEFAWEKSDTKNAVAKNLPLELKMKFMNYLDGNDLLQVISVVLAFFTGLLSTVVTIKDSNNQLNKKGIILIITFLAALVTGAVTTVNNSIDQKKALSTASSTLENVEKVIDKSDNTLQDVKKVIEQNARTFERIETLQTDTRDILSTLSSSLENQSKLNRLTLEILEKNSALYENMKNQNEKALRNYNQALSNCLKNLYTQSVIISFRCSRNLTDSSIRAEAMNTAILDILQFLRLEISNPLLYESDALSLIWSEFDTELRDIHLYLNGYNSPPIQESWRRLDLSTRRFINLIQSYKTEHNDSFYR